MNDRDAKRIVAAAQTAGLKKIDYFVLSHYHADHVGGLPALAKMIPIGRYFDHGETVEDVDRPRLELYKQVAGSARTTVRFSSTAGCSGLLQLWRTAGIRRAVKAQMWIIEGG
jgi:glyoxylase-like metal-dependent hydrolase (beta-lactamase superfamily II)